ncbi:MAG: 50S ribosomal protein L25 [Candidatus Saccharimonadales bacterium]
MSQDTISLALEARETTGKAVKHLRKEGVLPAVIHDHGKPSLNVQVGYVSLFKVWQSAGKHHPVALTLGTQKFTALIKDASFDPKKHLLTHVVFNAVSATEKVEAEIPVHARYDEGNESSPAERSGYMVLSQLDAVMVEAIASKLPDALYYDAEKLVEIGDHATVDDLIIPEGVIVKIDGDHAIATVYEPSALAAANEAAGGDAEDVDATSVEAENGTAASDVDSQAEETKPGGKEQAQPKGE